MEVASYCCPEFVYSVNTASLLQLWTFILDFLKDTGGSVNHSKSAITNGNEKEASVPKIELQKTGQKESKVTITKVFEFAGEEVR